MPTRVEAALRAHELARDYFPNAGSCADPIWNKIPRYILSHLIPIVLGVPDLVWAIIMVIIALRILADVTRGPSSTTRRIFWTLVFMAIDPIPITQALAPLAIQASDWFWLTWSILLFHGPKYLYEGLCNGISTLCPPPPQRKPSPVPTPRPRPPVVEPTGPRRPVLLPLPRFRKPAQDTNRTTTTDTSPRVERPAPATTSDTRSRSGRRAPAASQPAPRVPTAPAYTPRVDYFAPQPLGYVSPANRRNPFLDPPYTASRAQQEPARRASPQKAPTQKPGHSDRYHMSSANQSRTPRRYEVVNLHASLPGDDGPVRTTRDAGASTDPPETTDVGVATERPASPVRPVVQPASRTRPVVQPASRTRPVAQPASRTRPVVQPVQTPESVWVEVGTPATAFVHATPAAATPHQEPPVRPSPIAIDVTSPIVQVVFAIFATLLTPPAQEPTPQSSPTVVEVDEVDEVDTPVNEPVPVEPRVPTAPAEEPTGTLAQTLARLRGYTAALQSNLPLNVALQQQQELINPSQPAAASEQGPPAPREPWVNVFPSLGIDPSSSSSNTSTPIPGEWQDFIDVLNDGTPIPIATTAALFHEPPAPAQAEPPTEEASPEPTTAVAPVVQEEPESASQPFDKLSKGKAKVTPSQEHHHCCEAIRLANAGEYDTPTPASRRPVDPRRMQVERRLSDKGKQKRKEVVAANEARKARIAAHRAHVEVEEDFSRNVRGNKKYHDAMEQIECYSIDFDPEEHLRTPAPPQPQPQPVNYAPSAFASSSTPSAYASSSTPSAYTSSSTHSAYASSSTPSAYASSSTHSAYASSSTHSAYASSSTHSAYASSYTPSSFASSTPSPAGPSLTSAFASLSITPPPSAFAPSAFGPLVVAPPAPAPQATFEHYPRSSLGRTQSPRTQAPLDPWVLDHPRRQPLPSILSSRQGPHARWRGAHPPRGILVFIPDEVLHSAVAMDEGWW